MDYTSILLIILNSNYWLDFILIFYYPKFNIIYVAILSRQFFSLQGQWPCCTVTVDDHLFHWFSWFTHFPRVWPLVRIAASVVNYFPSLRVFTICNQGDRLYPTIFNVVVEILSRGLGYSAASAALPGYSIAEWEGRGRCQGGNWRGVGVAADDEESSPNNNSGTDSGSLELAPLLGSDITYEEGADPKENPPAGVAAPAEAITAGLVAADTPEGRSSVRNGRGVLLLLLLPLVSGDGTGATVDVGGEGRSKGKSAYPPGLGRFQQRGSKGETDISLFIFFSSGLGGGGQGWIWGIKHKTYLSSFPVPGLQSLVNGIYFSLRQIGGGAVSISPFVIISFETLYLVIMS